MTNLLEVTVRRGAASAAASAAVGSPAAKKARVRSSPCVAWNALTAARSAGLSGREITAVSKRSISPAENGAGTSQETALEGELRQM